MRWRESWGEALPPPPHNFLSAANGLIYTCCSGGGLIFSAGNCRRCVTGDE